MSQIEDKPRGLTFHLVSANYYKNQDADEDYIPEYVREGKENFIHCTDGEENMVATANRHYKGVPGDFYVLVVNLARVVPPVKYEDNKHIYPHIYGPLNRDAIIGLRTISRADDGTFLEID